MKTVTVKIPITVRYFRTPYTPARTSGPSGNCYPGEGGELIWEIIDDEFDLNAMVIEAILEHEKRR